MDNKQAIGDLCLTLGQEQEPSRLIINWQRGKALVYLINGTVIEVISPSRLDIRWPERRDTPEGTERRE